jgi:hypothetical protein
MDTDDRQEQEEMLDLYLNALGMIPGSSASIKEKVPLAAAMAEE